MNASTSFERLTTDFLKTVAQPVRGNEIYAFEIQTIVGRLLLHPHERWVACRFDDPAAASASDRVLGPQVNPWSGKWNFHYGQNPGLREFYDFQARLLNILPDEHKTDEN